MEAVNLAAFPRSQLSSNKEMNLVELPEGTSDFIWDSSSMPLKQSTKSSFLSTHFLNRKPLTRKLHAF